MAEQYYSFDEALKELKLKEEELKRLVSEGQILAYREGTSMKLKREDVENLRAELSVVDVGDSTEEELVFEDEGSGDDVGMATQAIEGVDTLIEEDVEDVGEFELDDEPEEARPVRRSSAVSAAAAADDETEAGMTRFGLIATAVVLLIGAPLVISLGTEGVGSFARMVGSIFPGAEALAQQP